MSNKKTITINGHVVEKIDRKTYQGTNPVAGIDFYITLEAGEAFADVFDSSIEDSDEAHLDSFSYASLEEAVDDLFAYIKD